MNGEWKKKAAWTLPFAAGTYLTRIDAYRATTGTKGTGAPEGAPVNRPEAGNCTTLLLAVDYHATVHRTTLIGLVGRDRTLLAVTRGTHTITGDTPVSYTHLTLPTICSV